LKHLMKERIVHWANAVSDGYAGYTYDAKVEIKARWEDKQEWVRGADGVEKLCYGVVFTSVQIKPGDRLYRGRLTSDVVITDGRRVEAVQESQDIHGRIRMYKSWIM
jgi:hypothetical protein